MATAKSKELMITNENYDLKTLEGDILQAFEEELDGLGSIPFDYIKIPSGGGIAFEVPGDDPDSPDSIKELKGIIIHHHPVNSFWLSDQLSNEAPDCQSNDGKNGLDRATGEVRCCATCPHNQFKDDGSGKECKNTHRIYLLREGEPLPYILSLPPTSLKVLKNYIAKRLLLKGKRPSQVVTSITLTKEVNKDGIKYAAAQFKKVGDLDPAAVSKADTMAQYIKKLASNMPAIDEGTIEAEATYAQQAAKGKKANLDIEYDDAPFADETPEKKPFPNSIEEAAAAASGVPVDDDFEEI